MKTHTFTANDFEIFKARVLSLVEQLGLTEWNLSITHEQIGDRVAAQTNYNSVSKNASIRLTINTEGDFGMVSDLGKLALHEVLHLLLADWCETTAKLGSPTHDLVIAQEHAALNRLMRIILLPKQLVWCGLTDAELAEFSDMKLGSYDLCLEVEAKLKEKNGG